MKKITYKILTLIVILILIANTNIILAATKSELQSQQQDTQQKIDEANKELNNIKSEKSETLQQAENLTVQISEYETQISELEQKISEYEAQISEAEEKIKQKQADYEKQEKLLNERLIASYEAGETSYLDVILSSESITDMISNYYLVSEVVSYDTELMEKIEKQKKEIETAKADLETAKTELDNSKASKETVSNQLKASKIQKEQQVAKLSEEEKQTQSELEQFEADKKAIANQIATIARQESYSSGGTSSGGNNTPSAGGFIRPVNGYSITCGWYGYAGHTGVDFSGSGISGKPVLAAKSGTVAISTALTTSSGAYRSYGEYIVINHHDGTMSLYAHGSPGSRLVSVGESVSQGQQIMSVGTTGNSTGPHLHFEIWLNGTRVNPSNYL